MISEEDGVAAVMAAREVATAETEDRIAIPELPPFFSEVTRGVFVTINEYPSGVLRGCIGYPVPPFDLARTLVISARGACHDPRFPPLRTSQVKKCTFEVSVLTEPEQIGYGTVSELKDRIRIGTDGLIVKYVRNSGLSHSALFLPQVPTEQGWNIDEYLSNLCIKAGLQDDAWKSGVLGFEKFQAEVFGEESPCGKISRK